MDTATHFVMGLGLAGLSFVDPCSRLKWDTCRCGDGRYCPGFSGTGCRHRAAAEG
jgi:hypothetical protein